LYGHPHISSHPFVHPQLPLSPSNPTKNPFHHPQKGASFGTKGPKGEKSFAFKRGKYGNHIGAKF